MAYCSKCGTQMAENVKFCPSCGTSSAAPATGPQNENPQQNNPEGAQTKENNIGEKISQINNTADTTSQFDKADIEQNKTMCILAYLGILVLIPMFVSPAKDSRFVRFHVNQGIILLIACIGWVIVDSVIMALLRAVLWSGLSAWRFYTTFGTILNLVYILFTILAIIGIINALNGKAKELPVIGKYKIIK